MLSLGLHIDARHDERDRNNKRRYSLAWLLREDDETEKQVDNDAALRKLRTLPGVRMVE